MSNLLQERADEIRRIARIHGATHLRVFGSQATGAATESSNINLLVELEPNRDLLDFVGLKQDLEELLNCHVDVVEEDGLSPYLRERVLKEARPL